jgi:hypothetical protein
VNGGANSGTASGRVNDAVDEEVGEYICPALRQGSRVIAVAGGVALQTNGNGGESLKDGACARSRQKGAQPGHAVVRWFEHNVTLSLACRDTPLDALGVVPLTLGSRTRAKSSSRKSRGRRQNSLLESGPRPLRQRLGLVDDHLGVTIADRPLGERAVRCAEVCEEHVALIDQPIGSALGKPQCARNLTHENSVGELSHRRRRLVSAALGRLRLCGQF